MSDLDELVTTERVRSVFEAREQVKEDERTLREAVEMRRVNYARARRLWKGTIDAYIHELEGLLNPPDDEPSEYWTDESIGSIRNPQGDNIEVRGLADFLALDSQITFTVQEMEAGRYFEIATPTKKQVTVQPSWKLLVSAFHTADAARTDLGLELSPADDDSGKWEFREIEDIEDINPDEWNDLSIFDNAHANGGDA